MALPYRELDLDRGEIRLVVVHPGKFSDPVRISLQYAFLPIPDERIPDQKAELESLRATLPAGWEVHQTFEGRVIFWNEKEQKSSWSHPNVAYTSPPARPPRRLYADQPEFEALSYCWDHGGSGEYITVEDQGQHTPRGSATTDIAVHVTDNLASALRHLRYEASERILWVDALCINQTDSHERARHVARMGSVYQLATRVIAWLGPESEDSTLALETLEHLGKQIEMTATRGQFPSPICDHPEWYYRYPCDHATIKAVRSLLHRRWCQRLWIWQEIVLANNDAVMQCGLKTIPWYYMRRGIVLLRETDLPHVEMRNGLIPTTMCWLPYVFEGISGGLQGMSKLLQSTSQAGCTDPRDRIYGLLGMCAQEVAVRIKPDYTLSYALVYMDFFRNFTEEYRSLILLQHCDLETKSMDGPTWVPDWSRTVKRPWQLVYAAGLSQAQVTFNKGPEIMSVLGVRAAQVTAVSGSHWVDPPGSVSEVFDMLQDWYATWRKNTPSGTPLESFITPIVYGWTYERRHVGASAASHARDWFNLTDREEKPSLEDLDKSVFLQSVIRDERNCAFFCTDTGESGLGPLGTKTGDTVSIILGSDHVIVLRPQTDEANSGELFKVVGPAYVHGLMDAECLLGKFRDPHRVRINLEGDRWTTFNTETGQLDTEDARLGPLPLGWAALEKGGYQNEEGVITGNDPRWSVDSLRKRGVKLEELDLI